MINKIKKAISLVLVFLMSISALFIQATADVTEKLEYYNSDEFRFVKAFDLMPVCNYDDFRPEEAVTRAEFARILCALCGGEGVIGGNEFLDIAANKYKDYIGAVYNMGLMNGYDKYSFLPENEITVNEVLKTVIVLLGYDVKAKAKGGYPSGYVNTASELKLNSAIKTAGNSPATKGDIARIIYNMRNVHCMENTAVGEQLQYEVSDKETFLTFYLGMDYIKGLLTDNGITSLRGDGAYSQNKIKIGDIALTVAELNTTRAMIGRYVEAYYTVDNNGDNNVVKYIQLDEAKNEEITVFDISDFKELNGRKLRYENNDKIKEINFGNFAAVVYNGKGEKVITKDMFDYDYGTVTYVPSFGNNPDVIIIEGFITWFVTSVDREFEIIRGDKSSRKINDSYQLELKTQEINSTVFIEDCYGLVGNANDIMRYSVIDISKNGEIMFIRISEPEVKDKTIQSIEVSDKETLVLFDDGENSRVIPYYSKSSDFNAVKTGAVYYVYKNSFGDIAALVFSDDTALKFGFFIDADIDGNLEQKGFIKVLDNNNTFHTYEVEKKINWSDENNNTSKESFANIYSKLQTYDFGLVNYALNKDGKISTIYLPVALGKSREMGRLGCIFDGDSGYYESGRRTIGKDVIINSSTGAINMFKVYATETNDEDKFMSGTAATLPISNSSNSSVKLKAFNTEPNSKYGEILVQTHSEAPSDNPTTARNSVVIRKMTKALYKNEPYIKMECTTAQGADKTLYALEEDITNVPDTMQGTSDTYTLKEGDIIFYRARQSDSSVAETIFLWWRSDLDPIDSEGKGRRGFIPGNLGYFDATRSSVSNPYKFNGGDGRGDWTQQYRAMAGYVYYVDSKGGFDVTSQDLSYQEYDASLQGWGNDNKGLTPYTHHALMPHYGSFAVISYKDGEVFCRQGKVDDVRSYLVDGNECSRILFTTSYGAAYDVFIINGEMN